MTDEKVLVISNSLIKEHLQQGSFTSWALHKIVMNPRNHAFLDRETAEKPGCGFKQLIPYCIFQNEEGEIVKYLRGKGGDSRLHGGWSVGIGGHINAEDENYVAGYQREIEEEVAIEGGRFKEQPSTNSFVNDDSNEVGRVHLGIVHLFTFTGRLVSRESDSLVRIEFVDQLDVINDYDEFETWSQLILKAGFESE